MTEIDPMASNHDFYVWHMRRHREALDLSQGALGDAVGYTGKFIGHVETKRRRPNKKISVAMDELFGVPKFFEALLPRIAEEAGLPPGFWEYVEEERRASQIRIYSQFIVPGLLQNATYAREVMRPGKRAERLDELVQTRVERQEIFQREDPPNVIVLLEEGTLRKVVGNDQITKGQLQKLVEYCREPNFAIYVLRHSAQVFPEGSFTILSFEDQPDVGYEESVGGQGRLIEAGRAVTELGVGFELIRQQALPAADSEALICEVLEAL